jgi:hypothetical protein
MESTNEKLLSYVFNKVILVEVMDKLEESINSNLWSWRELPWWLKNYFLTSLQDYVSNIFFSYKV